MPRSLYQRSIEIILENQDAGGAYPASPGFPTYRFCWMRDGSFTAYAMDLVGQGSSAERFHDWAARTINGHKKQIDRAISRARRGEPLTGADYLHTRFHLSGEESRETDWPNYQLDGYGTWLWALGQHALSRDSALPNSWREASDLVAEYLTALWASPCYDCWEEFPDKVHSYTLAALSAGLRAHTALRGADHGTAVRGIESVLLKESPVGGHFVKYLGTDQVDASLIALAIPYGVVPPEAPAMRATVERIEHDLRSGGGVHRYAQDTYYGGGEWVLLTAWLGWYYREVGEPAKVAQAIQWVEDQADGQGRLPEQVPASLIDQSQYAPWVQRWGHVARPLLWSHAMYLILLEGIRRVEGG